MKYDHDEVRCEAMADHDCDCLLVGESRTCCVCVNHGCAEALAEREKHPLPVTKENHENQVRSSGIDQFFIEPEQDQPCRKL